MSSSVIIPKDLGKGGSGIGFIGRLTKLGKKLSCLHDILVSGFLADFAQAKTKFDQLLARLDDEGVITHQYVTGEKAAGTIVAVTSANYAAGGVDQISVGDGVGVRPLQVIYFDTDASRVAGANETEIIPAGNANAVCVQIAAAIAALKAAGKLDITEAHAVPPTVTLTNDHFGVAGNVSTIEHVVDGGFSCTGMIGGLDPLGLTPVTEAE
jgi:hypothetical protein